MTKQIVNVGTNQDDGTGDNLRDAFVKVNANFTEIYSELGGTSLSNLRFSGSTITTDATNTSIILDPQGVGKITLNGDTHIAGNINATAAMVLSGNLNVGGGTTLTSTINVAGATTLSSTLDVTGASTFTGNVTAVNLATTGNTDLGNATSDTITATGRFDSNIIPSASATYDLGTSSLRWNNLYTVNANISGDITLGGNLVGGDANTDTITLNAELTSDIVPDVDSIYSLGSTSKRWENVWVDQVTATSLHSSGIEISDTTIKTSTTNNDLTLTASGTGDVVIDSVKISDLTANRLALVGINGALQDDSDFTYVSGGTLTAKYLSTEKITVDNLQLDGNTLSVTTGSLILSPVTDQGIDVNSEKILNLATPTLGTDAANKAYVDTATEYVWTLTDETSNIALIQNTEDLKIIGGSGITSVLSYGSPGHILTITNTDTLADVLARGNEARSITSSGHVDVGKITVDQHIRINTNRIETLKSNSDLELSTSGTGQIWIRGANAQIDGTLAVTSTSTFTGATTHTGGVLVPNDGFVGSAGQSEAIKIASDGDVTFKADVNVNAGTMNASMVKVDSNISLNGNKIFTVLSNSDIDIQPSGTGSVNMRAHVILQNQSGDPSGVTNASHIYAKDDTTSEVYVRDEAGNVTKISPHNNDGEWEYYSRNIKTGKVMRVNMERMVRKLEEITGETFIEEI
jgi:hypothetical protein